MEKLLTTRELAEAIGASASSMRRWTNSGAIQTSRTVGGHRRIPLSAAIRFIRESGATVVRPQALGLAEADWEGGEPGQGGGGATGGAAGEEALYEALADGDAARAKGQVLTAYLGGAGLAAMFDGPLARAMHRLGELWRHDPHGVLVEHRATDICLQAVNQLRQLLPAPDADAPAAVGGAPPGDPYLLPSMMAAAVLADAGYRVTSLGADTPLEVLAAAAAEHKASLVWLSVSAVGRKAPLRRGIEQLARALGRHDARLLVGGRHARPLFPRDPPGAHVLATMSELAAFTRGAMPAPTAAAATAADAGRNST